MNFQTAIFWLSEGKKIRRKNWNDIDYIELVNGKIFNKNNEPVNFSHLSTLMADDWETFKFSPKVFENDNFKITIENREVLIKHKFYNFNGFCFVVGTSNFDILKKAVKEAERTR